MKREEFNQEKRKPDDKQRPFLLIVSDLNLKDIFSCSIGIKTRKKKKTEMEKREKYRFKRQSFEKQKADGF